MMKFKRSRGEKFIFSVMFREKVTLIYFLVLGVIISILNIIEPQFSRVIIDKALSITSEKELLLPAALWFSIFLLKYLLQYLLKLIAVKYKIKILTILKKYIFVDILKKKFGFYYKNSPAYLLSRINNDIENLDGMLATNLITALLAMMQILTIIMFMGKINIALMIMVIVIKAIELYANVRFPLKEIYKAHNEALAQLDKSTQNTFSNIKLIKIANGMSKETRRYQTALDMYFAKRARRDNVNVIRETASRFLVESSYPIIVILGGLSAYYGYMTLGAVIAFIMYFQKLTPLFNEAAYIVPIYKISQASAERIGELLDSENEDVAIGERLNGISSIELKNLTFSYGQHRVLDNINMKLEPQRITAIIGVSGSGKSTIVNLLLGFFKPDSGEILINGKNMREYNINEIRQCISVLFQETPLFQRSLKENLAYHCATNERFEKYYGEICQKADIQNVVRRFDSLSFVITQDNGGDLSGGEKQRLCLARELYKNVSVNIFDEATSALDAVSENIIMHNIKQLAKENIVLIITHKMKNVKDADIIYVLDEGEIKASGTHEELMGKSSKYIELYNEQMKEE